MDDKEKQVKRIHTKVDELQDEYFQLLIDVVNKNTGRLDRTRNHIYYWERLKDLQQQISHNLNFEREISLDIATESLEEAFTQKIKNMLSDEVRKKIEDDN